MQKLKIAVIPGDGIGPEVTAAAHKVLKAIGDSHGHTFTFDVRLIGGAAIDAVGDPLPAATIDLRIDNNEEPVAEIEEGVEGLPGIEVAGDGVAEPREHPAEELDDRLLVVDNQNALHINFPLNRGNSRTHATILPHCQVFLRQINTKRGASPDFAVDRYIPAVGHGNAVHHGQAHTGTAAHLLCGEERLKDSPAGFGIHTDSGIRNLYSDIITGFQSQLCLNKRLIKNDIICDYTIS